MPVSEVPFLGAPVTGLGVTLPSPHLQRPCFRARPGPQAPRRGGALGGRMGAHSHPLGPLCWLPCGTGLCGSMHPPEPVGATCASGDMGPRRRHPCAASTQTGLCGPARPLSEVPRVQSPFTQWHCARARHGHTLPGEQLPSQRCACTVLPSGGEGQAALRSPRPRAAGAGAPALVCSGRLCDTLCLSSHAGSGALRCQE